MKDRSTTITVEEMASILEPVFQLKRERDELLAERDELRAAVAAWATVFDPPDPSYKYKGWQTAMARQAEATDALFAMVPTDGSWRKK